MEVVNFETACNYLEIDATKKPDVSNIDEVLGKSIIAFYELSIIAQAKNMIASGDVNNFPDWNNEHQVKHCIVPEINLNVETKEAVFVCKKIQYISIATGNYLWSNIVFKKIEDAEFIAAKFNDKLKDLYLIK